MKLSSLRMHSSFEPESLSGFEQPWWRWPVLLVILALIIAAVRYETAPITFPSESVEFVGTAKFIAGVSEEVYGNRYIKPLPPAGIALIAESFNVSYRAALYYEAFLMYVVLALCVYWFGLVFFKSRREGALLSIVVITSYPIVRYSLDAFTESGAWAFYFASLAAMICWYETPRTRWLWLTAGILLLGILWKEYGFVAGLIFGVVILFHPRLSALTKAYAVAQGLALTLLPWGMWQWWVYAVHDYTYFDWLETGMSAESFEAMYTLASVGKSITVLLLLLWPFVLIGAWYWRRLTRTQRYALTSFSAPSFSFLLWGGVSSRLFFSLVPLAAPIVVHGLRQITSFRAVLVGVLLVGALNITAVAVTFDPVVRDWLNQLTYGDTLHSPEQFSGQ